MALANILKHETTLSDEQVNVVLELIRLLERKNTSCDSLPNLRKYRGMGGTITDGDAQDYVKGLRENDRV